VPSIFDEITQATVEQAPADNEVHSATAGAHTVEKAVEKNVDRNDSDNDENTERTNKRLRDAAQELLRYGLLEEEQKPNLYRVASTSMQALNTILEPLDLCAHADDIRGLIYIKVYNAEEYAHVNENAEEKTSDEWSHTLIRKQRLTLEQTLLVAILRQYFIAYEQEAGTGASQAIVAVDELIPQLQIYLGDTGSESKERNRVLNLLDQLKGHGIVSAVDSHGRVIIRPIIAHLANPENLQALLHWLREKVLPTNDVQESKP